jgi:hypothetical protein
MEELTISFTTLVVNLVCAVKQVYFSDGSLLTYVFAIILDLVMANCTAQRIMLISDFAIELDKIMRQKLSSV